MYMVPNLESVELLLHKGPGDPVSHTGYLNCRTVINKKRKRKRMSQICKEGDYS